MLYMKLIRSGVVYLIYFLTFSLNLRCRYLPGTLLDTHDGTEPRQRMAMLSQSQRLPLGQSETSGYPSSGIRRGRNGGEEVNRSPGSSTQGVEEEGSGAIYLVCLQQYLLPPLVVDCYFVCCFHAPPPPEHLHEID